MLRQTWQRWFGKSAADHARRRNQPRRLAVEALESRWSLAADLAALSVATPLANVVVPGQNLAITAQVKNAGNATSAAFQVEYRLSADATITTSDLLLGTSQQAGLAANGTINLSKSVTIPPNTAKGSYRVGIRIVAAGDGSNANNALAESVFTRVFLSSLTGTVTFGGSTKTVAIRSYRGDNTPIFDDRPTWIVIHGRNSSPGVNYLAELATTLDGFRSNDQVLVLDWSAAAASGALGGGGENYIIPVGAWMAGRLSAYGLSSGELNLIGHSWGAEIAAEAAERMPIAPGTTPQVNSIVALEPAADFPGGSYNPLATGQVNFARNSRISWAFSASGSLFGSPALAQTADEAVVVLGSDHTNLVRVFTDLVRLNTDESQEPAGALGIAAQLDLSRLLAPALNTAWAINSYNSQGQRVTSGGIFESVIEAGPAGATVKKFRFVPAAR